VGKVGEENANDNIDLEKADQAAATRSGRDFRDVNRAKHGRTTDGKAADEARGKQGVPIPGDGAADRRQKIKNGEDAEGFSAANVLADNAGTASTNHRAPECDGDRKAESGRRKQELKSEGMSCSSNDGGVKAKKQAAKGTDNRASPEVSVQGRLSFESAIAFLPDVRFSLAQCELRTA